MYSILRAGHVFADVFYTQGSSMYYSGWCILYSGKVHIFADVVYTSGQFYVLADIFCTQGRSMYWLNQVTEGRPMYSLMYSVVRAVLCNRWCILYSWQVCVFADLVYTQGSSLYSLMFSVFRGPCIRWFSPYWGRPMYWLMYYVLRAGPCISWCILYSGQVHVFADADITLPRSKDTLHASPAWDPRLLFDFL